jgi:hypothetical protein
VPRIAGALLFCLPMAPYRDKRFVAEHRGGPLNMDQHRQLILWSCECVEHVLPLASARVNEHVQQALCVAREWAKGNTTVGEARKASVAMLALARELTDPGEIAVVRAAGHAVATAHMADHSLGGALYALKATKHAGLLIGIERKWQNAQLPPEIEELVISSREKKEKAMGLL